MVRESKRKLIEVGLTDNNGKKSGKQKSVMDI